MKYTLEERLEIGRRIYDGEISRYEAAEQYGINDQTARNYMRMYPQIYYTHLQDLAQECSVDLIRMKDLRSRQ